MSRRPKRLIVIAGGTGGHVFPGLEIAHYLISRGWQVRWLGTADRIEADLVPKNGIKIDFIRVDSLRGKGVRSQVIALLRIWQAVWQSILIMRRFQPDVALGMGGYVAGPGSLSAWFCGIPVLLHEQNGIAGLTNRWLMHIAKIVLQAFPGAFVNATVVGNPLRKDILTLPTPVKRLRGRVGLIRVLVTGGSQGAQVLNQIVPKIAARLSDKITLWHQVGKGAMDKVLCDYEGLQQTQYIVTEFIDDMSAAYSWADVVICRAGGLTVSEVAAVGLPAIFVPFPHKDRQQYLNARPLEEAGAAKILEQPQFNADTVCNLLTTWNRPMLLAMAEKARTVAILDSTERIAKELIRLAQ
ncbi:undecaprenyldiphospho-muramoylpentapeptide beta-N-acetylglucosaminyltransferase [Candidatus Gillettellia adelgis]